MRRNFGKSQDNMTMEKLSFSNQTTQTDKHDSSTHNHMNHKQSQIKVDKTVRMNYIR